MSSELNNHTKTDIRPSIGPLIIKTCFQRVDEQGIKSVRVPERDKIPLEGLPSALLEQDIECWLIHQLALKDRSPTLPPVLRSSVVCQSDLPLTLAALAKFHDHQFGMLVEDGPKERFLRMFRADIRRHGAFIRYRCAKPVRYHCDPTFVTMFEDEYHRFAA
jgi:hypothetical protein